jgi:hypothetical protein
MAKSHWAGMGQNSSMPPRSNHPGLKWRRTAKGHQPYWVARQVVRDLKGFPDRTIRLPADAGEEILGEFCRDHTARLLAWIAAPDGQLEVTYSARSAACLDSTSSTPIHHFTTSSATPGRLMPTASR